MIRDRRVPSPIGPAERMPWNGRPPWTLDHLLRRQWSITNRSGYTARSVRFTAHGALEVFGQRAWTMAIEQLDDGQGYAISATATWGSTIDKPLIDVTWVDDRRADRVLLATLRWPASSACYPGGARE